MAVACGFLSVRTTVGIDVASCETATRLMTRLLPF